MKTQLTLCISGTLLLVGMSGCEKTPERPMNVVYILADDLGYGDVGCYGQQIIKTPNIDRMAKEGMLFTQHYAGCTVSAPSRCSLMTGLHTGHTQVRGNREITPEGQQPMREDTYTLGKLMKSAGYTTGIFGKWGLGNPGSVSIPNKMGFDEFYGYNCQRQSHSFYPDHLWHNEEKVLFPENENNACKTYSQDLIHEQALKFIRDHKYVGDVMAELKELGLDKNTIVIFTSDNGPHHEGGADPDFFKSYGPFRGIKRDVYEGGIRIPMVAWCPGTIKAGAQSDHISAFWDVMPTLAELTGTVLPEKTDGISFLPTLLSKKDQQAHDYLYWEFHELNGREALRSGKWKLIRQPIVGETILELYDLSNDIHEDTNLAEKYPDKVKELAVLMDNARIESPYFNFGREK